MHLPVSVIHPLKLKGPHILNNKSDYLVIIIIYHYLFLFLLS